MSEEKKKKNGRPKEDIIEKYSIDLKRLEKIAAYGITDAQLADLYGVSAASICDWKKTNAKFSEAIKRGSEKANSAVVKSLFKRALGYAYNETTHERMKIEGAETPAMKVKVVRKQVHPDTTACIFWLKNRRGEDWRDVREQKHSGAIGTTFADGLKKIGDSVKSNPELEAKLENELMDK